MRLILVRHGEAGLAPRDFERALTEQGVRRVRALAARRADELKGTDLLLVSPYLRARQTAELLGIETRPEISDLLVPESDPRAVTEKLAGLADARRLVLVAHNPLLSRLTNLLLGAPAGRHHLGTAGAAAVELAVVAAGCGDLVWLDPGY